MYGKTNYVFDSFFFLLCPFTSLALYFSSSPFSPLFQSFSIYYFSFFIRVFLSSLISSCPPCFFVSSLLICPFLSSFSLTLFTFHSLIFPSSLLSAIFILPQFLPSCPIRLALERLPIRCDVSTAICLIKEPLDFHEA